MVKVLPEPVTPSSVWCARPAAEAVDQRGDRLRLVARRLRSRPAVRNGRRHRSRQSRIATQNAFPYLSRVRGHPVLPRDHPTRRARPAHQALAHARRHGARRAAEGRGQGHHRPRRRRAGFRHARAHRSDAGVAAIRSGFTRYTAVEGIDELKDAIIAQVPARQRPRVPAPADPRLQRRQADHLQPLLALLDPGDEAIIPAPYWVSYPDMVLLADGTPVLVFAGSSRDTRSRRPQLEAAITPRTRLFILNSPSNPTGAAYSNAELQALGAVLERHPHVVIGTDDMYEHICWGPEPFCSFATACPRAVRPHRHDQRRARRATR